MKIIEEKHITAETKKIPFWEFHWLMANIQILGWNLGHEVSSFLEVEDE